ncbi:hypothetical protein ACQRBK_07215 [Peptoniphilaceae bacterium SGI.137]
MNNEKMLEIIQDLVGNLEAEDVEGIRIAQNEMPGGKMQVSMELVLKHAPRKIESDYGD